MRGYKTSLDDQVLAYNEFSFTELEIIELKQIFLCNSEIIDIINIILP